MEQALEMGRKMEGWFETGPGSPEASSWETYFRDLGWHPITFEELAKGKSWTAPCQWPDWIGNQIAWRPAPHERREMPKKLDIPDRRWRQSHAELQALYGANWGLKSLQQAVRKPKPSPTDDELRAIYGKPREEISNAG